LSVKEVVGGYIADNGEYYTKCRENEELLNQRFNFGTKCIFGDSK
jgi:hypothetical protein